MEKVKREYPKRNLFPTGTVQAEGSGVEYDFRIPTEAPLTLELPAVRDLLSRVNNYLRKFTGDEEPQGQCLILRGEHGSGKTHTVKYLMSKVATGAPLVRDETEATMSDTGSQAPGDAPGQGSTRVHGDLRPFQIYLTAMGPSFLDIFAKLLAHFRFDFLVGLNERYLAMVAAEQFISKSKMSDPETIKEFVSEVRSDPSLAQSLIQEYRVEKGAVREQHLKEIEKVEGSKEDFQRAFSYLSSPELGEKAYHWIVGNELSSDDQKTLGVAHSNTSLDTKKWTVQLILGMFNRVRWPVIIYLDQYERLVLDKDLTAIVEKDMGPLQSLIDTVPSQNGLLVLSGNDEAFPALRGDLRQRAALNVVKLRRLTPTQAKNVIRIYVDPGYKPLAEETATPISELENSFYPFKGSAVVKIITNSGGNIRRLVQVCYAVFEQAYPQQKIIDASFVDEVLGKGELALPDKRNVGAEVERLLVERSLSFKRDYKVQDMEVDFAVTKSDDNLRLLIQISEAVLHEDESRDAQRNLELRERIDHLRISAPLIVVVVGYVSPEVTKIVRPFVYDVLTYNPETFRTRFGSLLNRIRTEAPAMQSSPGELDLLKQQLAMVQEQLARISKSREAERQEQSAKLSDLLDREEATRFLQQRRIARVEWAARRGELDKEIRTAREDRRKHELSQLETQRGRGERERRRQAFVFGGVIVLLLLIIHIGVKLLPGSVEEFFYYTRLLGVRLYDFIYFLIWSATVLGVGLVVHKILIAYNVIGSRIGRELSSPVSSVEELDRLAHSLIDEGKQPARLMWIMPLGSLIRRYRDKSVSADRLLNHPNPHFRYVGVIASSPSQHFDVLIRKLRGDLSPLIRRTIAKRLASAPSIQMDAITAIDDSTHQEIAYIVEAAARSNQWPASTHLKLSSSLKTLAILCGARSNGGQPSAGFALATILQSPRATEPITALAEAFLYGLDRSFAPALRDVNEATVRDAEQLLSPIDSKGLGAYDELETIGNIDRYYIFIKQVLFMMERDILAPPSGFEKVRQTGSLYPEESEREVGEESSRR